MPAGAAGTGDLDVVRQGVGQPDQASPHRSAPEALHHLRGDAHPLSLEERHRVVAVSLDNQRAQPLRQVRSRPPSRPIGDVGGLVRGLLLPSLMDHEVGPRDTSPVLNMD